MIGTVLGSVLGSFILLVSITSPTLFPTWMTLGAALFGIATTFARSGGSSTNNISIMARLSGTAGMSVMFGYSSKKISDPRL